MELQKWRLSVYTTVGAHWLSMPYLQKCYLRHNYEERIGASKTTKGMQSITFEASDRSRSLPLALIQILASELSLAPIREIAR